MTSTPPVARPTAGWLPRRVPRVALLGLALGLAACNASAKQSDDLPDRAFEANDGTRVEVAHVQLVPAEITLTLSGEVEGSRDANLASALGGYVESVKVDDGDRVQRGDLLVAVDRQLYSAGYAQAEAQRDLAKGELARLVQMGDGVSDSQRAQAETNLKVAEAALAQASVRLRRSSVTAPFDGIVSAVAVSEGEVTGPGTPVARLVQLDPVVVAATVSDRDLVTLRPGQAVRVTAAAIGQQLDGEVRKISPVGDGKTRSFRVEVAVPNPDQYLLPGMVARLYVQSNLGEAIVVPQDWVISRPSGHGVFVADGDVARWRTIELGQVLRNQVIVTAGITPGDPVIMVGHRELLDEDPILVSREGRCCEAGRVVYDRAEGVD